MAENNNQMQQQSNADAVGPNTGESVKTTVPEKKSDSKILADRNVGLQANRVSMPSSPSIAHYPNVQNYPVDLRTDYNFKQVEDLLPTIDPKAFEQIDPEYLDYLGKVGEKLDRYVRPVVSNINAPLPGNASANYNPVAQSLPTRSSNLTPQPSGDQSRLTQIVNTVTQTELKQNESRVGPVAPLYFSRKAARYDRYYNHPSYDELGFHPYVNNEEFYNANSTVIDDAQRMFGQAAKQFGSAFMSTYRSIGDLIDEDNYWTGKDDETAREFMSATDIGMSSRGGVFGFANNLILNSSYTVGIITNIVLEDIVLNWVTGGATSGMTAAKLSNKLDDLGKGLMAFGKGVTKLPKAFTVGKYANTSQNVLRRLTNIDAAKDFYAAVKGGTKWTAELFMPNTIAGLRSSRAALNTADGAVNIAKGSNVFFDMYKDFRELNFAMSEAKLEGGIVYQEQFTTALAEIMKREGVNAPTQEMMNEARENAVKASRYTTMLNAPFIYLSNKIVLGKAFKGFDSRFMRETFEEGADLLSKRVIRKSAKKAGQEVFEDVGEGMFSNFKRMRALGAKGTARQFAQGSLRYFAANVTEGVQELYQEAVTAGTQDYYTALASDPSIPSHVAFDAALSTGIGSQISAQGFETFLSGFLMGGLVQGPQNFVFSTIPNLYKTSIRKDQEYINLKKERDSYVAGAVKSLNETIKTYKDNPLVDVFSMKNLRMNGLTIEAQVMNAAEMNGSIYDYFNAQDHAKFLYINSKVQNGSANLLKDHFSELETLSDEDLTGYYGEENTAENAQNIRQKLNTIKSDITNAMNAQVEQVENPFNYRQYKEGSTQYNQEKKKHDAFQHALFLQAYTRDTFISSTRRYNNIATSLQSDPIIENLEASDLTVLLDPKSIQREINILEAELQSLEGSTESNLQEQIDFKTKKVEALRGFQAVLQDPANFKGDETFNRRLEYVSKLKAPFLNYVQLLADSRDGFVNQDVINKTLQKIVDYGFLKGTAIQYAKALEVMMNPATLNDIAERMVALEPVMFQRRENLIKEALEKQVNDANVNALFNKFFELGVITDVAETKAFINSKNKDVSILKTFYTDSGQVNSMDNAELYTQIEAAKNEFAKIQETLNPKEETTTETGEVEAAQEGKVSEVDQLLEENGFTVYEGLELGAEVQSEYLTKLSLKKYSEYKAQQKAFGREVLEYNDWLNNADLGQKLVKGYEALRQVYANRIAKSEAPTEVMSAINTENIDAMLDDVREDKMFSEWLTSDQTAADSIVDNILTELGTSYNDMLINPILNNYIKKNGVAALREIKITTDGKTTTVYKLLDNSGKEISQKDLDSLGVDNQAGYYTSLEAATEAFNLYSNEVPDTTPWMFQGTEIRHGDVLIKTDGSKYIVISQLTDLKAQEQIKVVEEQYKSLPLYQQRAKAETITAENFDLYTKESVDQTINKGERAYLNSYDAVGIYPFKRDNESLTDKQARERLKLAMSALTEDQLNKLVIEVSKNEVGSKGNFTIKTVENGKEVIKTNPLIEVQTESFNVALRVGDVESQIAINDILEQNDIDPINFQETNIIAQIPNGTYVFKGGVQNMDQRTANEIFTKNTSNVDVVKKNFAINKAFVDQLNVLGPGTYTLASLSGGFTIDVQTRRVLGDGKISPTELNYNTVEGNTIVYRREAGGRIAYTSIKDTKQQDAFIERVEARLAKDNRLKQLDNYKFSRFAMVVEMPNGKLEIVTLDQTSMGDTQLTDLVSRVIEKSNEVRSKDKIDTADVKNFNDQIAAELFITGEKNTFINLEIDTKTGFVKLRATKTNAKAGVDVVVEDSQDLYSEPSELLNSLIDTANNNDKFTKLVGKTSKGNFKAQSPEISEGENLTAEEVIAKYSLVTGVAKNITTANFMNLAADGTTIQAVSNVESATNNSPQEKAPRTTETVTAEVVEEQLTEDEKRQKALEDRVEELKRKEVEELREEDGSVLEENIAAWKQNKKDIQEAKDKARRGNKPKGIAFNILDRSISDRDQILSEEQYKEADKMIESVIQMVLDGKLTATQAHQYIIGNMGYAFTLNDSGLLLDYINDRTSDAPEIGNNKAPFALWRKGEGVAKTETVEQTREQLEQAASDLAARIQKRTLELGREGVPRDKRNADPILQELTKQQDELTRKLYPDAANKIIDGTLSYEDVTSIDEFVDWADKNLPDFISVSDINVLGSNLKKGGVRVGAFIMGLKGIGQGVEGNIYTGASNPFKYHEAFHSVFRMLLTDAQIDQYLSIGKKELLGKLKSEGKTLQQEMTRLKNSAKIYESMSDVRLEQELIEEYLADRFEEFKTNRKATKTDSIIKSFFNRLIEIIKSVFKVYSPNQLNALFQKIDAGKFKDSSTQQNRFTESLVDNVTIEADKLIPVNISARGTRYLDSTTAKQLISDMSASFIMKYQVAAAPIKTDALLDQVVEEFQQIYSAENNQNLSDAQLLTLMDLENALYDSSDQVKEGITEYLDLISLKQNDRLAQLEENFESEGERSTQDWDKGQELVGGVRSLPEFVRKYLATTTISSTDIFGRKTDGAYATTVDVATAYSGLVKSAKNTSNPYDMVRKMLKYSETNPQTRAVMERFLNDVGLDRDALMRGENPIIKKNGQLFQSFTAGFTNYTVDYQIILNKEITDGIAKGTTTTIFSALKNNNAKFQLNTWSTAYKQQRQKYQTDTSFASELKRDLNKAMTYLQPVSSIDGETIVSRANFVAETLRKAGISVNPLFIQYSILNSAESVVESEDAAPGLSAEELLSFKSDNADAYAMTSTDIAQIRDSFEKGTFLFKREEGAGSRLENIAQGNAVFDENVFLSTFKNANGDLVYAHQAETFHLKQIHELNNQDNIEALSQEEFLLNNTILNNPLIQDFAAQQGFKVVRVNGVVTENVSGRRDSLVYDDFSAKLFIESMVNMYFSNVKNQNGEVSVIEGADGTKQAVSDVLIRVIEASGTGDLVSLPVMKTIDSSTGKITSETIDHFEGAIKTEFDRIKKLYIENKTNAPVDSILGFNTPGGRGFKFFNTESYITPELQESLIQLFENKTAEELQSEDFTLESALKDDGVNSSMTQLRKGIELSLNNQYDQFVKNLENISDLTFSQHLNGIVSNNVTISNTSNQLLNLGKSRKNNLKQIFLNDLVNTEAINEILLGDQATSLKNAVDKVKRAKMQNGAGKSAAHNSIAPALGVDQIMEEMQFIQYFDPTGKSTFDGKDIDREDAQSYITVEAFRHMFFGFGKLTQQQADLLNKVKEGVDISTEELYGNVDGSVQGYAQLQAMLNSKKIVFGDGNVFIKTSAFVLTPQYTSTKESGYTEAKPNMKELHNLRLIMEAKESASIENGKIKPVIAAPITASKMEKRNVNELDIVSDFSRVDDVQTVDIDANFMRLQVINPSNKGSITDVTQLKTLITGEQLTADNKTSNKKNIEINGEKVSLKTIKDTYHEKIKAKVALNFRGRRNLLLDFSAADAFAELDQAKKEGKVSINLYAMALYAMPSLKASKASSNLLEIFSTENGEMKYDPNMPISYEKFEQIFLNFFADSINSKLFGEKFTIKSDRGHNIFRRVFSVERDANGDIVPDRQEVIRESIAFKEGLKPINLEDPGNLSLLEEELAKAGDKGVIILDRLRTNVKEYNAQGEFTGQRYSESIVAAQNSDVFQYVDKAGVPIPEVASKHVATRVPTQDKHSAMAAKVVDFLPAYYGSVAMYPQELVQVSGADFDVDAVFTHFKDFFVEDGQITEYGKFDKADTKTGFAHYINYLQKQVNKKGSTLNMALELYETNANAIQEFDGDTSLKGREAAVIAASMIGLPASLKDYQRYIEKYGQQPNEASINNELVDVKFALLGNEYMTNTPNQDVAIAYQPAGLGKLIGLVERFSNDVENFPSIAQRAIEIDVNVNSLDGKIRSFKNNKEGAGLIGRIVVPNNILSLVAEFNGTLDSPIMLDGKAYTNLNSQYQEGTNVRNQDIISEIVTATTDNAKERLAAKLGLTRDNLSILAVMLKLGMNYEYAVSYINTPVLYELFQNMKNNGVSFDTAFDRAAQKIGSSRSKIATYSGLLKSDTVNKSHRGDTMTRGEQLSLLASILPLQQASQELLNFLDIISTTKSLGTDVSIFDRIENSLSAEKLKTHKYIKSTNFINDSFYGGYVEAVREISEISKQVLVTRGELGSTITTSLDNTLIPFLTKEQRAAVKRDLVSYLTLSEYAADFNSVNQSRGSLTNDYLYATDPAFTPVKTVQALRDQIGDESNFFLDTFLNIQEITDQNNDTGLSLIEANTLIQLNDSQKVDLQNDFLRLYDDVATRPLVMDLVHYAMVKDALQYQFGGIIDAIPVAVLSQFNQSVINARTNPNVDAYPSFVGYFKSAKTTQLLDALSPELKKVSVKEDNGDITISLLDLIKSGRGLSTLPLAFVDGPFYALANIDSKNKVARYSTFVPMGSESQNPIGFIFDGQNPRPTAKQLSDLVRKNQGVPSQAAPVSPVDTVDPAAEIRAQIANPNNNVVANEKGIQSVEPRVKPTTQPQATQPVAGEQLELFGDVADVQSILDNAQETAGESNVFNLTPGPKLKYEALWESVNVAGNRQSLKDNGIDSAKAFSKFMEDFNGTQEQAEEHLRECFGIKF